MKICVTSEGKDLAANVDPRFGRCKFFIFVNPENLDFEAVENEYINATGGAGIQAGQFLVSKQAKVLLTGNVGPNAFQTLKAAGIDIFTGISGGVKEAIERYKKGELKVVSGLSVGSHSGMPGKNKF